MKKAPLFLVLSFLFIQCSTNNDLEEEEQQERPEVLAISITVEGDVFTEDREKILYISNEEGIIEGQLSLQNNQENLLTIQKEPNSKYHLIILENIRFNGRMIHDLDIFENIESSDYTIEASPNNPEDLPNVDFSIVNTGGIDFLGRTGVGTIRWLNENGGVVTSEGNCVTKPGDYFSSFKRLDEPFARYFWTENVEEDKSFNLEYEELPVATGVETQLPGHESGTVYVHGYKADRPSASHSLANENFQAIQTFKTYLPQEDIFDYFSFTFNFIKESSSYTIYSVSETFPSRIQMPSFDFTINNFTVEDIDLTTNGNYDISKAEFYYIDDNVNISVNVFSEQNSQVNFSIDTLINSLFSEFLELDAAELLPNKITLSSKNDLVNYQQALKEIIEEVDINRSPGYLEETIWRRNN